MILKYPGFTQAQIDYLSQVFPPVDPTPGMALDRMMYESGGNAVVRHILAKEEEIRESQVQGGIT